MLSSGNDPLGGACTLPRVFAVLVFLMRRVSGTRAIGRPEIASIAIGKINPSYQLLKGHFIIGYISIDHPPSDLFAD